jgi:pimeloyl-ACP methyl ester carboxylesterase
LEVRDILGAIRYIRSREVEVKEPVAVLGVSYGAVAALIAAAQSPEIAGVISDGAFTSGKDVSEDISRHYLHVLRRTFGFVRALRCRLALVSLVQRPLPTIFAAGYTWDRICFLFFPGQAASESLCCSYRAKKIGSSPQKRLDAYDPRYRAIGSNL